MKEVVLIVVVILGLVCILVALAASQFEPTDGDDL